MTTNNIIAIDGPSGSGKSTVSKRLAKRLSFQYIDTGAMYRAITYKLQQNQISTEDEDHLIDLLSKTTFAFEKSQLFMDGNLIGDEIRSSEIDATVSKVSADGHVRDFLAKQQVQIGLRSPSVIDGRDIGTVLFPNAILKIFLTADVSSRAKRRYKQNINKGISMIELEEIQEQIKKRDQYDSNREIAPLKAAPDAIRIDTSGYTVDQVVDMIEKLYKDKVGSNNV